jgi:hypothetical protein
MRFGPTCVIVVICALPLRSAAFAQSTFAIAVGPASFDASGTGNTVTVAGRGTRALSSWLGVELGLSFMNLDEQFASAPTRFASADFQARVKTSLQRISLSLGVGPSLVSYWSNASGRQNPDLGLSAGPGAALRLNHRYSMVLDGRYRGWPLGGSGGTLTNGSVELTMGLARTF